MHQRLFFALPVAQNEAVAIGRRTAPLRDQIDAIWIPPRNYHVTLGFLGDTSEDLIPDLIARAGERLDTGLLPFDWTVNRVSRFNTGVLYLSASYCPDALLRLAQSVSFSVPRHERHLDYIPHISLARHAPDAMLPAIEMTLHFDRVTLFRSLRTVRGPRYRAVHEWRAGDAGAG